MEKQEDFKTQQQTGGTVMIRHSDKRQTQKKIIAGVTRKSVRKPLRFVFFYLISERVRKCDKETSKISVIRYNRLIDKF